MIETAPAPRPAHILVIEDDPGIASVLERGLCLQGWTVTVADHGLAGRAAWEARAYDVAIVDVMLPGINGIELLAQRRSVGDLTPVLLLTACDEGALREQGTAAGADEYVMKPFAYRELIASVERLIARSVSLESERLQ